MTGPSGLTDVQAVALSVYARNVVRGSIEGALHEVDRVLGMRGVAIDAAFREYLIVRTGLIRQVELGRRARACTGRGRRYRLRRHD